MSRRILVMVAMVGGYFGVSLFGGVRSKVLVAPPPPPRLQAETQLSPASTKEATPSMVGSVVVPEPQSPFAYEREFQTFSELHGKVLLNEDEQAVKKALLEHVSFLRGVGQRLLQADVSLTRDRERENNLAIDLLLEALSGAEGAAAADILRDLVSDAAIEAPGLTMEGRQQLAGIKAEVLYRWSAKTPDMAPTMEGWLPGPISRKIWANVTRLQSANEAESQLERAAVTR